MSSDFYVRYYSGHYGRFGHEFLEFDYHSDGLARYANNSNYRNDSLIRKEMYVSPLVLKEVQAIVEESEIIKESDEQWPRKKQGWKTGTRNPNEWRAYYV